MNIYFCGSIAGGRSYLETYTKIVRSLQQNDHIVLTEHIIAPDVLDQENQLTPQQVYQRDVDWLSSADAVIAEISNPSLGVGYEIAYALTLKKPVLALYQAGLFVSRMITGNPDPQLQIQEYASEEEWQQIIDTFINHMSKV